MQFGMHMPWGAFLPLGTLRSDVSIPSQPMNSRHTERIMKEIFKIVLNKGGLGLGVKIVDKARALE